MTGQLCSAKEAQAFALAGNAIFTLRSERTGQRFTYRVRKDQDRLNSHYGDVYFVSWLRGPMNDADFSYFSFIRTPSMVWYHGGKKAKAGLGAPCVKAFAWFWDQLRQGKLHPNLTVWHEGKCGACGRKLTVPESIATGLGPECAGRLAIPQGASRRESTSFTLTDIGV